MTIVIGLGNPGSRYRATRHNLGFWVLDELAASLGLEFDFPDDVSGAAWVARGEAHGRPLVLAKPRTYMNRSGQAAAALCRWLDAEPHQLLVVYDDVELELGRIRVRPRGSAGGHNGMRSLIDTLQSSEIPRVRLGVRGRTRDGAALADYVLAPFDPDEARLADALADLGRETVQAVLEDGVASAMNRYNARSALSEGSPTSEDGEAS